MGCITSNNKQALHANSSSSKMIKDQNYFNPSPSNQKIAYLQGHEVTKQKLICPNKNKAHRVCVSPLCQIAALMCNDPSCPCTTKHKKCVFMQISVILQTIDNHKNEIPQEVHKSYSEINLNIDQMIKQLMEIKKKFQLEEKYFGLTELELNFMALLDSQKFDKINGKSTSELKKLLFEAQFPFTIKSYKEIRKDFELLKQQFNDICKYIQKSFSKCNRIQKKSILDDSKIIKQINQKQMIDKWLKEDSKLLLIFSNKSNLESKLLFRASEHYFSASEFHKHCDGVQNTLLIAKTEFDKVIGGFTPNKWHAPLDQEYVNDGTARAFVFSLTLKEKYKCKNPAKSIVCLKTYGPLFGGCDICIADNAQNGNGTRSDFPQSYNLQVNGTYKYESNQKTWTLFSGATNGKSFKLKQYEVYEIRGI